MYKQIVSVTPSGTTGAATGSNSIALTDPGWLEAVYLDYTSVTIDTRVQIQHLTPAGNVLSVTGKTDAWHFPRKPASNLAGTSYSSAMGLQRYPVLGTLVVRATSSTPTTNGVRAYIYIDED